ncbi:acetylornithine deacetylase [Candidatus Nitrosoglobus terrae]|uniref:Acetylornithine deacetylase n=1 Tax=Candidatus Nitrosoglobus terrae TaxID=1630141 RepID=A0A1Q2SP87_9GAMM|nr:acetylornithine deacetylase [Candidatus Nitrosoglobus terrae]BAW80950.1 acetylornithine deacetylase [Candidatus Nitrosoglobus terrae]
MPHSAPPLMEMITQLIATPSISSVNQTWDQSNLPIIELLDSWLSALGFSIEIQPIPDQKTDKANLIATLGQGSEGLILAGHTDTVPFDQGQWRQDPFQLTEREGKLYGLGTADMKAFLVLAIEAARSFNPSTLKHPLILLATADEESTTCGARSLVNAGRYLGRHALIGEPTGLRPIRQHKGVFIEGIQLRGHSGHSSNPALGNNALEGMHAVISELLAFRADLESRYHNPVFDVPSPTLNLGHIHGGDNPNRICAECELHFDLRPLPGMDIQELRQMLHSRVTQVAVSRGLTCKTMILAEGIPPFETPSTAAIIEATERLTGYPAGTAAFGTEGPFLNQLGMETVILGPGDIAQAHQPNEYLSLDRIKPTIDLLQRLIQQFCCH